MPEFHTPEEYVAFRVFKQRVEINAVAAAAAGVEPRVWWEVVDRFRTPEEGPAIVGEFDSEGDAERERDAIRERRLAAVMRGLVAPGDRAVEEEATA